MMTDDRDFYGIMALVLGLAIIGVMHSAQLRRHDDYIRYLMDNTVSRETEARPHG
jgi:hypothetical protein